MTSDDEATRAIATLDYQALTADVAERVKHQITLVDRGLQGLMLINGGALVALFTLIGNAHVRVAGRLLWSAFSLFALGLVLTLLANLSAFMSQGIYSVVSQYQAWDAQRLANGLAAERREAIVATHARGRHFELSGIAAALLALFSFLLGCALALAGVLPA